MIYKMAQVITVLLRISRTYPDEEIVVRLSAGDAKVGFAKGSYGDQQHAEWVKYLPLVDGVT